MGREQPARASPYLMYLIIVLAQYLKVHTERDPVKITSAGKLKSLPRRYRAECHRLEQEIDDEYVPYEHELLLWRSVHLYPSLQMVGERVTYLREETASRTTLYSLSLRGSSSRGRLDELR